MDDKYKPRKFDKIIRDHIPEKIFRDGHGCTVTVASDDEIVPKLIEKLQEEIKEFSNPEGIFPEELTDIYEVVRALAVRTGLTTEALADRDIINRAEAKRKTHGSFKYQLILKETL